MNFLGRKDQMAHTLDTFLFHTKKKIEPIDLDATDEFGTTQLEDAIVQNNVKLVELLLKSGANVHTKRCNDSTPLHLAAGANSDAVCKLLLAFGANVLNRDVFGRTPLDVSLQLQLPDSNIATNILRNETKRILDIRTALGPFPDITRINFEEVLYELQKV